MPAYEIEITVIAEEEYSSAFSYYEEKQPGLGEKFEKETEYLITKLKENPFFFNVNINTTGRLFSDDFPILLFTKFLKIK